MSFISTYTFVMKIGNANEIKLTKLFQALNIKSDWQKNCCLTTITQHSFIRRKQICFHNFSSEIWRVVIGFQRTVHALITTTTTDSFTLTIWTFLMFSPLFLPHRYILTWSSVYQFISCCTFFVCFTHHFQMFHFIFSHTLTSFFLSLFLFVISLLVILIRILLLSYSRYIHYVYAFRYLFILFT
jgi:hypothetical protein